MTDFLETDFEFNLIFYFGNITIVIYVFATCFLHINYIVNQVATICQKGSSNLSFNL